MYSLDPHDQFIREGAKPRVVPGPVKAGPGHYRSMIMSAV